MIYAISDLHLCGPKDEFQVSRKAFLDWASSVPDKSVIVVGDCFDLLRASLAEIEAEYSRDVIPLLEAKVREWVIGNHDREMLSFMDGQYHGIPVCEKLLLGNALFLHLHQMDPANGTFHAVGDTITRSVDWIADHTSQGFMGWARTAESWAKGTGRSGDKEKYRALALDFVEWFSIPGREIKSVCGGHTHQADQESRNGITYLNCGTWINGKTDFVTL
jgi:predicted phosphodiesterase